MIFHGRQWKWQTHFALLQEISLLSLASFCQSRAALSSAIDFCAMHIIFVAVFFISSPDVVAKYRDRIASLEEDIEEVLRLEKEEKEMATTELQLHKATAMLRHRNEILSRPKRSWFQSHRERMQERGTPPRPMYLRGCHINPILTNKISI